MKRLFLSVAIAASTAGFNGQAFALDRDDNPPGPLGGPGTNWENPPGPRGGPGASPNRRPRRPAVIFHLALPVF